MQHSEELKLIAQNLTSRQSFIDGATIEDLDLHYMEIASNDLGFSEDEIIKVGFEINDLHETYGRDTDVNMLISGEIKEQELWASVKNSFVKIVHAVNPGDRDFTRGSYVIGLPVGNFSSEYLVYADNEQDALDSLADYEVARRKADPNVSIFMVDTYSATEAELAEIQEREDQGEYMRLGNNSNLFDISNIVVYPGKSFSIDKGTSIEEHVRQKRQHKQSELGL